MVTRRGSEAAVLVPVDEWRRLKAAARPPLKQLLLSEQGRGELVLASRGHARNPAFGSGFAAQRARGLYFPASACSIAAVKVFDSGAVMLP